MGPELITDEDRYPAITRHGQAMLMRLREHPHAPRFSNQSGHRLTPAYIARVVAHEREVAGAPPGWRPGSMPDWLDAFVGACIADVPFYRRYGSQPRRFEDVPAISRADLSRDIAQFVPDHLSLEGLINFSTSGTSGHPLLIPSHPTVSAGYLAYLKKALTRASVVLRAGRGQVGVVLLGYQRQCFTYVSVTPTMDESGLAKINLHPNDWRDPDDRVRYLDDLDPEVYTGDPISFAELLRLPLRTRPRALVSTSMTLPHALRAQLETRWACPVFDMYSMNETGPIAFEHAAGAGYAAVQHRMYIEILGPSGVPCAPGQPGEIVLTGGFNPYLPLLRYKTGDRASLRFDGDLPVLEGLIGRPATLFRGTHGELINNVDVTHALKPFGLPQFTLHQSADGALRLRARGDHAEGPLRDALTRLFGPGQAVDIRMKAEFSGPTVQYTADPPDAIPG